MANNELPSEDGRPAADNSPVRMTTDQQHIERTTKRAKITPQEQSAPTLAPTVIPAPSSPSRPERVSLAMENEYRYYQAKSEPYGQWTSQISEMEEQLRDVYVAKGKRVPGSRQIRKLAQTRVRLDWIRHGIWRKEWDTKRGFPKPKRKWKHEEPLEWETDITSAIYLDAEERKGELRDCFKKLVARKRKRDASRPFHQFISQISEECERIGERTNKGEFNLDINTLAYEMVKGRWVKRGIWDRRWGALPGMQWKHEEPPEDVERAFAAGTVPDMLGKDGKDVRVDAKYEIPDFPPLSELGNEPAPPPTRKYCRKTARPAEVSQPCPQEPVSRGQKGRKQRPATRKKTNESSMPSGEPSAPKALGINDVATPQPGLSNPPKYCAPGPKQMPPSGSRSRAPDENHVQDAGDNPFGTFSQEPAHSDMQEPQVGTGNKNLLGPISLLPSMNPSRPPVNNEPDPVDLVDCLPGHEATTLPPNAAALTTQLKAEYAATDATKRAVATEESHNGPTNQSRRSRPSRKAAVAALQQLKDIGKGGPALGVRTSRKKNTNTAPRKRNREPAEDLPEKKTKLAPASSNETSLEGKSNASERKRKQEPAEEPLPKKLKLSPEHSNSTL